VEEVAASCGLCAVDAAAGLMMRSFTFASGGSVQTIRPNQSNIEHQASSKRLATNLSVV
jgi:hypothetical protein